MMLRLVSFFSIALGISAASAEDCSHYYTMMQLTGMAGQVDELKRYNSLYHNCLANQARQAQQDRELANKFNRNPVQQSQREMTQPYNPAQVAGVGQAAFNLFTGWNGQIGTYLMQRNDIRLPETQPLSTALRNQPLKVDPAAIDAMMLNAPQQPSSPSSPPNANRFDPQLQLPSQQANLQPPPDYPDPFENPNLPPGQLGVNPNVTGFQPQTTNVGTPKKDVSTQTWDQRINNWINCSLLKHC